VIDRPTSADGDARRDDGAELRRGQRLDHPPQRRQQPFQVRRVGQDEPRLLFLTVAGVVGVVMGGQRAAIERC